MAYEIARGKVDKAKKVCIYAPEGFGKSSFASRFPDPVFIDTEGSTHNLDVNRLPKPTSWQMLGEELSQVAADRPCGTLVIDTIDWAEQLCIENICARHGKTGIEDFPYGTGYVYEKEEFGKLLCRLDEVIAAGINVVLTAHAQVRRFSQPDEIGEYDRWELKLGKKTGSQISPLIKEWVDLLIFGNYKTVAVAADRDRTRFKAQGGKRVMYTEHHPCWDAKNRFGLSPELPFDYSAIAHLFGKVEEPKYWANPETLESTADSAKPDGMEEITKEDYDNLVRLDTAAAYADYRREKAGEKTEEKTAEAAEKPKAEEPAAAVPGIPKELSDLMAANKVTEAEIRKTVALRGYYPEETPVSAYDRGFIDGVLIGAWDKVFAMITERRELDSTPF